MLIKVEKIIFPVEFVVFDMLENVNIPLILGHTFLLTNRCNINLEEGKLTLNVYEEVVKLNLLKCLQHK